jgi:hypothetical protein
LPPGSSQRRVGVTPAPSLRVKNDRALAKARESLEGSAIVPRDSQDLHQEEGVEDGDEARTRDHEVGKLNAAGGDQEGHPRPERQPPAWRKVGEGAHPSFARKG